MDCFVALLLAMTGATHDSAFSRHEMPELCDCFTLEIKRAQGMPGVGRTRSLACEWKKARKQVTTGTPDSPAFPARRFTAYRALSLVCRAL